VLKATGRQRRLRPAGRSPRLAAVGETARPQAFGAGRWTLTRGPLRRWWTARKAAAKVERAQAANFVGYKPQPTSLMLPALPFLLIATLDRPTLYGRLLNRLTLYGRLLNRLTLCGRLLNRPTLLSHLANRRPGLPKRMVIGRDSGLNDSRRRHASLFGQFLKHLNRSGREPKTLHWISHKHLLNAMIV